MIMLTKLDNSRILLSLDNIKYVESTPDTLIFFINGESIMVRESLEELQQRVLEYKRWVLQPTCNPSPADK